MSYLDQVKILFQEFTNCVQSPCDISDRALWHSKYRIEGPLNDRV
jgi:hypothetical protein